jgi:hypothetical protein
VAYGAAEVLAPCFQITSTQAAPNKTQQNFKNTYCERNNLSQSYRGAQFYCVPSLKNETK